MRLTFASIVLAFCFLGFTYAQSLLEGLPTCGALCIAAAAPATGCNLTDIKCFCANEPFQQEVTHCVLSSCTTQDALTAQKVAKAGCGEKPRDNSRIVLIITCICFVLSTTFIVIRLIARSPRRFEMFGWDDANILVAWLLGIPMLVADIELVKNGLGKDVWSVQLDEVIRMMHFYFMGEFVYLYSTVFMKTSILAFYLRIFTDKTFKKVCYLLMVVVAGIAVSFSFVILFQCTPIDYAWTRVDNRNKGHCINLKIGLPAHSVVNIVADLVVLALPFTQVRKLQLADSWKIKAQITIMFGVGLVVTIVSMLRLKQLFPIVDSVNPTWDFTAAAYWSAIETYVGIICACLPSTRIFFGRILPKWLGVSRNNTGPHSGRRSHVAKMSSSKLGNISWKAPTGSTTVRTKSEDTCDSLPLTDRPESARSLKRHTLEKQNKILRTDTYHVFTKAMHDEEMVRSPDPVADYRYQTTRRSFPRSNS